MHPMRDVGVSLKLHVAFRRAVPTGPSEAEISEPVFSEVRYAESRTRMLFVDSVHTAILSRLKYSFDDIS